MNKLVNEVCMNNYIKMFLVLFIITLIIPITAMQNGVYFSAQSDNFKDRFKPGFLTSVGWRIIDSGGIAFDASLGFSSTNGKGNEPSLTRVPLSLGIGYFFTPQEEFSYYVLAECNLNFHSDPFADIGLGYGVIVGYQSLDNNYSSWFVDTGLLHINARGGNIFEPSVFRIGWLAYLDKSPLPRSIQVHKKSVNRMKSRRPERH